MKNKSIDLHNHLFAQLERLSDEKIDLKARQTSSFRSGKDVKIAETPNENDRC